MHYNVDFDVNDGGDDDDDEDEDEDEEEEEDEDANAEEEVEDDKVKDDPEVRPTLCASLHSKRMSRYNKGHQKGPSSLTTVS